MMAGGGGSTGGIGAQSPASGGFGGNMGGGFGGNMGNASAGGFGGGYGGGMGFGGNMGNNTRLGNNSQLGQLGNQFGQLGNMANIPQIEGLAGLEIGMPGGEGGQTTYGGGAPIQDAMYRPQKPMPQPSMGGIEQDQDFRNFRSQHDDLSRQMNEYMQKAPMYQQLQELQGKMQGVQSRYAPPQRSFNQAPQQQRRFNPQQQLGGLAALLGGLGGMGGRGGMPQQGAYEQYVDRNNRALASPTQEVKQPTMSRADFDARERQMMNPVRQQFNPAYFG
jgi:hypothetical protein